MDTQILPCASCHNYHLTTADRLKWHPDANPTPTPAEQRVSSTAVRAILAREVAAIPEPRDIGAHCWRCGIVCGREHEVQRPKVPLVGKMSA